MRFVDWSARVAATTGERDLRPLQGFGMQRGNGHLNFDGHRAWASTLADLLKAELPNLPAHRQTAL
jgi:lysophospholipase L1-like esterase